MSMIKFFEIWHNDLFDNPEKDDDIIFFLIGDLPFFSLYCHRSERSERKVAYHCKSKMYSRKGIPFSSVILCLFVCCNFESKLGGGLEKSK